MRLRHEVFTKVFSFGKNRRFNLNKILGVRERAHLADCGCSQSELFVHRRSTEVEIAIFDSKFLVDGLHLPFVADGEGKRARWVQDFDFRNDDFDVASRHVWIFGRFRALGDFSGNA